MACAPQAVREAEDVVAQADSLWHAGKQYGIDEGDSATLAQAYKTLEAIPLPFREGLGLGSPLPMPAITMVNCSGQKRTR